MKHFSNLITFYFKPLMLILQHKNDRVEVSTGSAAGTFRPSIKHNQIIFLRNCGKTAEEN